MSEENFEQQLTLLEQAVERLESGELSLEESMQVYEEGVLRAKRCRDALAQAEQRVVQLRETADGSLDESPFDRGEER